jgi:hypothetical protein
MVIFGYNLKAIHNKDYSVVKTFKAAFAGRFCFSAKSMNLFCSKADFFTESSISPTA